MHSPFLHWWWNQSRWTPKAFYMLRLCSLDNFKNIECFIHKGLCQQCSHIRIQYVHTYVRKYIVSTLCMKPIHVLFACLQWSETWLWLPAYTLGLNKVLGLTIIHRYICYTHWTGTVHSLGSQIHCNHWTTCCQVHTVGNMLTSTYDISQTVREGITNYTKNFFCLWWCPSVIIVWGTGLTAISVLSWSWQAFSGS